MLMVYGLACATTVAYCNYVNEEQRSETPRRTTYGGYRLNPIPLTPYSTDSSERDRIVIWIAFLAILAAYLIHVLLDPLNWQYSWLVDPPSAVAVYSALRRMFGTRLWCLKIARTLGIVEIPNLNGTWLGTFTSSYDDFATSRECRMEIKQNWYSMSVLFWAENSESVSVMAGISVKNAAGPQLSYCYANRAKYDQNLADHDGTQFLRLNSEEGRAKLTGEYYTNRKDGQTRGHVVMYRKER